MTLFFVSLHPCNLYNHAKMAWLVITGPSSDNLGVWHVINWPVISHCILKSTNYWRMCSKPTFFKPNLVGLSYKQRYYCLMNNLLRPFLYSYYLTNLFFPAYNTHILFLRQNLNWFKDILNPNFQNPMINSKVTPM